MTAEMIERVAKASFECWRKRMDKLGLHLDKGQEFEDMTERELAFAYENARAMIAAMREPTKEMLQNCAAIDFVDPSSMLNRYNRCKDYAKISWQAMIDAALKE